MKIALTGRKQSGKDYLGEYLLTHHKFNRVSFSDQLKKIADTVYPWGAPHCEVLPEHKELPVPHEFNVNGLSYRELWMSLDVLRDYDPNVFVHGAARDIANLKNENILVTDIRKQVEFDLCVANGFTIIKIENIINPSSDKSEDIIDTFKYDNVFYHDKSGQELFALWLDMYFEIEDKLV